MSEILTITVEGPGADALLARIRAHADLLGIFCFSETLHAALHSVGDPARPAELLATPLDAPDRQVGHA